MTASFTVRKCSAFQDTGVCTNGFIQNVNCRDPQINQCCGTYRGDPPPCMRDELPEHWVKEEGSPKFYKPREPEAKAAVEAWAVSYLTGPPR